MSAALPTVTSFEKPSPFCRAYCAKVSAMLPLWEISSIGPAAAFQPSALTRPEALNMPAQLGPIMRAPARRKASANSCSGRFPSGPVSPKPAVITTTAGTPSATQSLIVSATKPGRTSTIANSTGPGTARNEG